MAPVDGTLEGRCRAAAEQRTTPAAPGSAGCHTSADLAGQSRTVLSATSKARSGARARTDDDNARTSGRRRRRGVSVVASVRARPRGCRQQSTARRDCESWGGRVALSRSLPAPLSLRQSALTAREGPTELARRSRIRSSQHDGHRPATRCARLGLTIARSGLPHVGALPARARRLADVRPARPAAERGRVRAVKQQQWHPGAGSRALAAAAEQADRSDGTARVRPRAQRPC